MKSKMVFDDEWVKTSPMLSARLAVGVVPKCAVCGKMSCEASWYSIKQKIFRCLKCFTPKALL